jgi:hypothetical protein
MVRCTARIPVGEEKMKPWRNQKTSLLLAITIVSVLFMASGFPVRAQDAITLSALEVDLWPEYDRPSVLVIYRITLSSSVSLPVDLSLRIPAVSGDPHAVAVRQLDGGLFSVAYDRQIAGDWAEISFTATMPEVQIEYYDPRLTMQEATRQFEFTWPGDYAVDAMTIQIQQPLGASDLRTSPGLGSGIAGQDGLVYYNSQVGAMPVNQTFNITVNYNKSGSGLSAESLVVQPSAPVEGNSTDWRGQLMSFLPWGLAVLGIVLIVGGGLWYWQSGKRQEERPQPRRRRRGSADAPEVRAAPSAGSEVYCHQCGKRAGPGDRFCRACGTKLRLE